MKEKNSEKRMVVKIVTNKSVVVFKPEGERVFILDKIHSVFVDPKTLEVYIHVAVS